MIPTLDNTASEIVQYQRDSTVQRKDLAQKTKDFRKLEDSAKLGEIKGLLKGWSFWRKGDLQADQLFQHIKHSSTFLRITRSPPIPPSYRFTPRYPKPPTHTPYSRPRSILFYYRRIRYPKSHRRMSIYRRA